MLGEHDRAAGHGNWAATNRIAPTVPSYDPTTALLIVDVQNDFADPSGSLYVAQGEQVVPFINREIDRARAAGAPPTGRFAAPPPAVRCGR